LLVAYTSWDWYFKTILPVVSRSSHLAGDGLRRRHLSCGTPLATSTPGVPVRPPRARRPAKSAPVYPGHDIIGNRVTVSVDVHAGAGDSSEVGVPSQGLGPNVGESGEPGPGGPVIPASDVVVSLERDEGEKPTAN
jgi:hypothetical protein